MTVSASGVCILYFYLHLSPHITGLQSRNYNKKLFVSGVKWAIDNMWDVCRRTVASEKWTHESSECEVTLGLISKIFLTNDDISDLLYEINIGILSVSGNIAEKMRNMQLAAKVTTYFTCCSAWINIKYTWVPIHVRCHIFWKHIASINHSTRILRG